MNPSKGISHGSKEPRLLTWASPLAGFFGTVAGMLITFSRIGTEPQWKTVIVGLGSSSVVGLVAGLIVFLLGTPLEK
jgi:biopolymer transport protein ExbB/TolQ